MPVLERNLALLAAAGLPPRVLAFAADMFALYVGGFAFEESMRAAAGPTPPRTSSPRTSARCRRTSSRRCARSPTTSPPAIADERFEFALELLVRGLEAMADDD